MISTRFCKLLVTLACLSTGLSFTAPVLAELFPTLLPPVQPWRYTARDSCIVAGTGASTKEYLGQYPGDSPEEVVDLYVADKNALCRTYGGWLNTFSRIPGVPTIHASDADSLYPAVVAQGFKIHVQHDPLPSCPSCQAWSEDVTINWPDRQCGHNRTIGDWNQPGFFREENPSYGVCKCGAGRTYVAAVQRCVRRLDRYASSEQCPGPEQGNPINVLRGFKRERITLDSAGLFELAVEYSSRQMVPADDPLARFEGDSPVSFGPLWNSTLHRAVRVQGLTGRAVSVGLGAGQWQSFASDNGSQYTPVLNSDSKLVRNWWRHTNIESSRQDVFYPDDGRIQVSHLAGGFKYTYIHSTDSTPKDVAPARGYIIAVTDPFGRQVAFTYEQPANTKLAPRVNTVTRVDGEVLRFFYNDHGYLSRIEWPDGKSKTFLYEHNDLPWALTGIVDEEDTRYATFGYDAEGRATSTEHAMGTHKFSTRWTTPPRWLIRDTYDAVADVVWREHTWVKPEGTERQDPLGNWSTVTSSVVNGIPRQTSGTQAAGSGCEASSSQTEYDSRANVLSRLDFGQADRLDRRRTCYAYQANRNVETHRVEGLLESTNCPPDLAAYQVPGNLPADKPQRKISTTWHPLWKLETRRAEPKRITTTIYNGEKDPLDADKVITCADGDPKLPDNSKIAVVCRRYEQATDDESGNLQFTAPVKDTRKWSYTYNQHGQVLSEVDPRGKATTYEYWADTGFTGDRGHRQGDLKKVSNALNQAAEHLEYNKRGQVLTTKYANGSQELREYHPRGWLTKVTLVPAGAGVGQVTQYDYYDTGLLKKATQPDGSWAFYTWDAAHRLKTVKDSADNSVEYVLDNMGNREEEIFKDPQGALVKTISRTFDALGRMDSSKGLQ